MGLDSSTISTTIIEHGTAAGRLPLRVWIPGEAAPGGSKTSFKSASTRKIITIDSAPRNSDWRAAVALFASQAFRGRPLDIPLVLTMRFFMRRPKSHYGTGRNAGVLKPAFVGARPTGAPDCTKLLRAAEDALTQIIWRDDSIIVEQHVSKVYGDQPGLELIVDAATP